MDGRPKVPLGRMHIDDEMREVTLRILNSGQWIKGQSPRLSARSGRSTVARLGGPMQQRLRGPHRRAEGTRRGRG